MEVVKFEPEVNVQKKANGGYGFQYFKSLLVQFDSREVKNTGACSDFINLVSVNLHECVGGEGVCDHFYSL